ncbi:unnamed protein product [Euphydryas editha]|uniref:Uncharacterized protein n=1 Tax=Euphydryas editha TaxID=104508 RepID=A0AAU9U1N8_EUPED|nr:unnamed protein product [Euphydryas editha]
MKKKSNKRTRFENSRKKSLQPDDSDTSVNSEVTYAESDDSIWNADDEIDSEFENDENVTQESIITGAVIEDKKITMEGNNIITKQLEIDEYLRQNVTENNDYTNRGNETGEPTKKIAIFNDLEETSETLEEERLFLWDNMVSKKRQTLTSLPETSEDLRKELLNQLNSLQNSEEESTN